MQRRANLGLTRCEAHDAQKNALRLGRRGEIRDRNSEAKHIRCLTGEYMCHGKAVSRARDSARNRPERPEEARGLETGNRIRDIRDAGFWVAFAEGGRNPTPGTEDLYSVLSQFTVRSDMSVQRHGFDTELPAKFRDRSVAV